MAAKQGTMTGGARGQGAVRGGGRGGSRGRTDSRPLLPSGTAAFFRRRMIEIGGLVLAVLGVLLLLACLTFRASDPSLNFATEAAPQNMLGLPGAYMADLALQSFGLVGLLSPLMFLGWGWQLMRRHRVSQPLLRISAGLLSLLVLALAAATFPVPESWPLRGPGLGGVVGDLLWFNIAIEVAPSWIVGLLALICGTAGYLLGLGFSWGDYGRVWSLVGLSAGNGVDGGRRLASRGAAVVEQGLGKLKTAARRFERREPSLDLGKAADKPQAAAPAPKTQAPGQAEEPEIGEGLAALRDGEAGELVEPRLPRAKPGKKARESAQRKLDFGPTGEFELPPLLLLDVPDTAAGQTAVNRDALEKNARLLEGVLEDFGVKGEIVKIRPGPVVTRYELEPAPGIKTSRVVGLADDIARSMSAISVRVAVVPGSSVIGIELPNTKREIVYLRELLGSESFERTGGKLPLILGKDIGGEPCMVDLARMPHLLIAGTTGSGKSVSINALILSMLYRFSPRDCRFIMIDPKMLELSVYDGIPHLLSPVVTEPKKAVVALKWTVREMEERYRAMSRLGVRNIDGYNARIEEARAAGEVLTRKVQTGFDPDTGQPIHEEQPFDLTPLPYIVVVVDEMADLMLVAGKDIEAAVQRLAQMARAAGIHLIMATQRPSVDVITGTIKANFPTRISFHVTSKIDSRTILGETGAEQLLGQGDMLYMAHGGRIIRVHGPLVTDGEVEEVVAHLKRQEQPTYIEGVTEEDEPAFEAGGPAGDSGDELYDRAVALICQHKKASTSFVQRHLQIGYNRAARIIERMEAEGLVSEANHVGKREVLVEGGSHD